MEPIKQLELPSPKYFLPPGWKMMSVKWVMGKNGPKSWTAHAELVEPEDKSLDTEAQSSRDEPNEPIVVTTRP